MKCFIGLMQLGFLFSVSVLTAGEPVSISIIYDNYQVDSRLKTDWGFACLIEYQGHKLLFDAGRDAELYKKNMGMMEISPEEIHTLFISHEHGDHTAGKPWIIESNTSVNCYLPSAYAAQLKASASLPPKCKSIASPAHLYGPFYSTGDQFEAFNEQGLIVKTEKGGILITGCGHPGPIEMIKTAERELGIKIHAIIGGLHLMRDSPNQLEELAASLKKLGIEQICPTHCTGDQSIALLAKAFGEGYISGGTGKIISIQ